MVENIAKELREFLSTVRTEVRIQEFLDQTSYSADDFYRAPLSVLRDRKANCVDGAVFGAFALRFLGHKPLIMELRAWRDDDHFLAVFRKNGGIGAIAKSNFAGLRWREPVYRSFRELAMSYFEDYYNVEAQRTLRAYSLPVDLSCFDHLRWWENDGALEAIIQKVDRSRHIVLLKPSQIEALTLVDRRSYESGMLGINEQGLYRPK